MKTLHEKVLKLDESFMIEGICEIQYSQLLALDDYLLELNVQFMTFHIPPILVKQQPFEEEEFQMELKEISCEQEFLGEIEEEIEDELLPDQEGRLILQLKEGESVLIGETFVEFQEFILEAAHFKVLSHHEVQG